METFNLFIQNNTNYIIQFVEFQDTSPGSEWVIFKKIINKEETMQINVTLPPKNTLIGVVRLKINNDVYSFIVIDKQQREAGVSTFSLSINDSFRSKVIDGKRNPVYPNILQWKEISCEILNN